MVKDKETNIQEIKDKIQKFCEARDWDQFHGAKDLAIGIITEASEVLEHFRWKSEKEVKELFENPHKREEVGEEMADVFFFLLRLAQRYDIDLSEAIHKKMDKNEGRYPIDKFKGSNKKYNEV